MRAHREVKLPITFTNMIYKVPGITKSHSPTLEKAKATNPVVPATIVSAAKAIQDK